MGAPGIVPFGYHADVPVAKLGALAAMESLRRLPSRDAIQAAFVGCVYGGSLVGQRVLRGLGYSGVAVSNFENACASSGTALHHAIMAVESGELDTALVLGVEKLSALGGGTVPLAPGEVDQRQGVILPALYALRAHAYMAETGCTVDDLVEVVVKNRGNGANNPYAHRRDAVSADEVRRARPIAEPLTKLHCCPTSDGAAAVVVSSRPVDGSKVRVLASVMQGGIRASEAAKTDFATARLAGARAYEDAGLSPSDIDVAEVHDAFSIAEPLYYEALGWAEPGYGFELLRSGATRVDGRIPVNPSGGLLARGHPLGASGVAQVVEMWRQLQGRAGANQVGRARTALCQVSGGGASGLDTGVSTVHVLAA